VVLVALAFRSRECHSIRPCPVVHLCRVAGRDCSRQAPSERHVQVSLHAAQALRTPCGGRGVPTSHRWLWTGAGPLGWRRTRLSTRSVPPWVRHTIGWLCQPVSAVRRCWQMAHKPSCAFQRRNNWRRPGRCRAIRTPARASKEGAHCGSYGLASPWIFVCRRLGTLLARQRRTSCPLPDGRMLCPQNTQWFPGSDRKSCSLIHPRDLCGCRRRAHCHSRVTM
jgi:hypothetical protein